MLSPPSPPWNFSFSGVKGLSIALECYLFGLAKILEILQKTLGMVMEKAVYVGFFVPLPAGSGNLLGWQKREEDVSTTWM